MTDSVGEAAFRLAPWDEHNKITTDNVHPSNWVNPTPDGRYNLVVIGAGTAGLVSAIGAAGLGAKVALIERHLMGGDCLNVGCVPSKALIRAAKVAADARRGAEFGVRINGSIDVDFGAVMERMRKLRADISHNDSARRFTDAGVDVFIGSGEFTGSDSVRVGDETLRFSKAVIATGARAVALPIEGLEDAGYLTNETVFSLTEMPRRLIVIGAGPIGVELSQAFARFGSEVSLLEAAGQILVREDRDAAKRVEASLTRDGVRIVSGCSIKKVTKTPEGKIVELDGAGGCQSLVVDEILVGVGRAPNVEGMGLESVGVDYDVRKGIVVDDFLQTTNSKIFAAGDCCSQYKFTHTADALARIVIQNALFGFPFMKKKASALTIPWCTYTDPEIAHVGMYEQEAKDKGIPVATFTHELADVDRAILDGADEGFVKVHVKEGTDQILGATIVAEHAGEMLNELTLAMNAGLGLGAIASTIHPYPTQAECIKRVADAFNRTRLTPGVKGLFARWLAWTR
jgi:pyruvate/2-oxoglutarate dehydrogenase complex dihydrolipoamide dehydrogenase (E3) component